MASREGKSQKKGEDKRETVLRSIGIPPSSETKDGADQCIVKKKRKWGKTGTTSRFSFHDTTEELGHSPKKSGRGKKAQ